MKKFILFVLLAILLTGMVTAAIYKWVDDEGKVHYGDCPQVDCEPQEIKLPPALSEEETRQSQERLEKLLEQQKRSDKIRNEVKERKRQEKATKKRQKVENKKRCIFAQQQLYTLLKKRPVYSINEKGERVYLDDENRAVEIERMKKEIELYCNN